MMKKFPVALILFISFFQLRGQERNSGLGLMYSYDFISETFADSKNQGFHAGLRCNIDLGNRFYFHTGLLYSTKYFLIPSRDILFFPSYKVRENYLNIPLMIGYRDAGRGKFHMCPSLGINNAAFISNRVTTFRTDGSSTTTRTFKPVSNGFQVSFQFNLGFEYQIQRKTLLTIEPYVIHGINKPDKIYSYRGDSYGGILGLYYLLN